VPDIATAAREQLDRWARAQVEAASNALAKAQLNSNIELTRGQIISILNTLNAKRPGGLDSSRGSAQEQGPQEEQARQAMAREMKKARQQMSDNMYRAFLKNLGAHPTDPPA
jgi:hypothetical protein